jgi:DNA-binding transcriptional MerR regulator/uncharacterized glyoxalase superfamily protein PhnB
MQIGELAALVGLSVPQLRRYERLGLLEAAERSPSTGYRCYRPDQVGTARVIALLRAVDMPIADVRRMLAGTGEAERQALLARHRARLEARLKEVQGLLDAVEELTREDPMGTTRTELSAWLHVLPRLPVRDLERSADYYEEALGLEVAWRTDDGRLAAVASAGIELLLLVAWEGEGPPPPQSAYVYVEDPDARFAECREAGAEVVEDVASRPYGMRNFTVRDPDGHCYTLGAGEAGLREVAARYALTPEEIAVNPGWITARVLR